jgi:hypothetical protein
LFIDENRGNCINNTRMYSILPVWVRIDNTRMYSILPVWVKIDNARMHSILPVWVKIDTFYFKLFCLKKKRKNSLIRGKLS